MAVSGTGVALATAGGVLLYAGLKGESPLVALREIASGKPSAVPTGSGYVDTADVAASLGTAAGGVGDAVNGVNTPGFPDLVNAVYAFRGDRYSQLRRWQDGFSDCSSFVGKGFKRIGIKPPGASVTGSYLTWRDLTKVSITQALPGDLLVNANHIVVVTGPNTAIGQENPSRNVATGSFSDLMGGTGAYVCLRYSGAGAIAMPAPNNRLSVTGK